MPILGILGSKYVKPYKDEVLADSPIGFWLLDETSGTTATDSSTNAINATYYNTPTLGENGTGGGILKSVFFDGASSESAYTNATSTFNRAPNNSWSYEVWYKDNTTTNTTFEVACAWRGDLGSATDLLGTITLNNSVAGRVQAVVPDAAETGFVILTYDGLGGNTNWHHVAVTAASGGTLRLYVDGVERATSTASRGTNTVNKRAVMGANWNVSATTQFYTGNVAAYAIYNTELSAQRVLDHYNAGK